MKTIRDFSIMLLLAVFTFSILAFNAPQSSIVVKKFEVSDNVFNDGADDIINEIKSQYSRGYKLRNEISCPTKGRSYIILVFEK